MGDPINQIIDLILKSDKILVTPSSPPDGDSIGSALALFEGLKKLGKKVTVVCADPVPESLRFLPGSSSIIDAIENNKDFVVTLDCNEAQVDKLKYEIVDNKVNIIITPKSGEFSEKHVTFKQSKPDYDLVIAVDTADTNQLGSIYSDNTDFFYNVPIINIDHHVSNINFGTINYVDSSAASATEILFRIFKALEERVQKKIIEGKEATYLLTGILTDTGSFQNPNTTPKALEASAELVERGASQQEIVRHVFRTKNLTTLKLWGEVLSKIETDDKHKIIWSTMTQSDLAKTNAKIEEISGLIDDMLVNAPDTEIVFIIKEDKDKISCSMRSTTPAANVSEIAEHFGGGGHVQASGFRINGKNYNEAVQEIVSYIRAYQAKRLDLVDTQQTKSQTIPQTSKPVEKIVSVAPSATSEKKQAADLINKVNQHLLGKTEVPRVQPIVKPLQPIAGSEQNRGTKPPQKQTEAHTNTPNKNNRQRNKRRPAPQTPVETRQNVSHQVPQKPPRTPEAQTPVQPVAPVSTPVPPSQASDNTSPVETRQNVSQKPPSPQQSIQTITPPPVQPVIPVQPVQPATTPPSPVKTSEIPQAPQASEAQSFDPFNPPNSDESDILAALDKL